MSEDNRSDLQKCSGEILKHCYIQHGYMPNQFSIEDIIRKYLPIQTREEKEVSAPSEKHREAIKELFRLWHLESIYEEQGARILSEHFPDEPPAGEQASPVFSLSPLRWEHQPSGEWLARGVHFELYRIKHIADEWVWSRDTVNLSKTNHGKCIDFEDAKRAVWEEYISVVSSLRHFSKLTAPPKDDAPVSLSMYAEVKAHWEPGELYWDCRCVSDQGDGDARDLIQLSAATFPVGTKLEIKEPSNE